MSEVAITEADARLSSIVVEAHSAPVFLTRHGRRVAAVVDVRQLAHLVEDAEDLADIRAFDSAIAEAKRLQEAPIRWDDVKRGLG